MHAMKTHLVSLLLICLALIGWVQGEVIFYEDFSGGLPGAAQGWSYYNSHNMESSSIGVYPPYGLTLLPWPFAPEGVLNEAVFVVDLASHMEAVLALWYSTEGDVWQPPLPPSFSGHYNGSGISWSHDGYNWTTLCETFVPTPSPDDFAQFMAPIPGGTFVFIKIQNFGNDFYGVGQLFIPLIIIEGDSSSITVPGVVGLSHSSAEAVILSAGLTVGTVTPAYSSTVPAGNVISQTPLAGVIVPFGSSVNLVVSQGPAPTGSLQVTLLPMEAVQAGAQWRRLGTTPWFDSGTTENNIVTGSYTVEFKEVSGWQEPSNLPVTISVDAVAEISADYTPATFSLVTIGDGTAVWNYPLATFYHDARTQTIYRAGEVGGACIISGLSLYVTQAPVQSLNTFTIRLKHSDLEDYSTYAQWQTDNWTVVYQANQTISATGWVKFDFSDMFFFNGVQNLMVDFSFNNSTYTSDAYCRSSTLGGTRSLVYRTDSGFGNNPLAWSGSSPTPSVSNNAPNIRLYLEDIENLVTVPDMVGLTQTQAEDSLQSVGLGLGAITYEYSNAFSAGLVFSQVPEAGSLLPEGFNVGICISLGPIYSGGSGTSADPFQIANVDDLLCLAGRPEDYANQFVLTADIDLGGENFTAAVIAPDTGSGTLGFQGATFAGVFDGNDFTIHNLTIAAVPGSNYIGLFGKIGGGGLVKNLNLKNIAVSGGSGCIGGLTGNNSGTVSDCRAAGSVSGADSIGGLAGENFGIITSCSATVNVSGTGQYSYYIGGLCGSNWEGIISDCYAGGSVSGYGAVGGLCGYNYKNQSYYGDITISDSYATAEVSGIGWDVGGLAGYSESEEEDWHCEWVCDLICDDWGCWEDCREDCWPMLVYYEAPWLVSSSFWDTQTSGKTSSSGGTGLSTAAMQTESTFTSAGWDFAETWAICEGTNYPRLRRQIPPADFVCPDGVHLGDFAHLAAWWMKVECANQEDCDRADLNQDGTVDIWDLLDFSEYWMAEH